MASRVRLRASFGHGPKLCDEQFSLNASSQLDRIDELINSFLHTGEQVCLTLSFMSERNAPAASLISYTATQEATKQDAYLLLIFTG